ncbi:glycosyltransferase [Lachnospiraceae bacterium MD335]|nr:glycosyltransferase [Lachnospiraceae bacterium MD335]
MKKILFVITMLGGGGAERALCNLTFAMPADIEYDILVSYESDYDYPHKGNVISLGMEPIGKLTFPFQIKSFFKRIFALKKLKKRKHYDACISFMDSANIANILTGKRYCKTIVSVRNNIKENKSLSYQVLIGTSVRMLYNRADTVTAVSQGVKNSLIKDYGIRKDKIKVITNGFDTESIKQLSRKEIESAAIKEFVENSFVFVAMGRLCGQKAQWHLIRAFSELCKRTDAEDKKIKLLIMGKGSDREYLEKLTEYYGLTDKIMIVPFQTEPFGILSRCSVYVMTSMFEGYSNALCEAVICGLPCITTDFQTSAREILAPNTAVSYRNVDTVEYAEYGIIVPVCSGKRHDGAQPLEKAELLLAEAMQELVENKVLYEEYKQKTKYRSTQLDISDKVKEWIALLQ